jgi:hypothetical protein
MSGKQLIKDTDVFKIDIGHFYHARLFYTKNT